MHDWKVRGVRGAWVHFQVGVTFYNLSLNIFGISLSDFHAPHYILLHYAVSSVSSDRQSSQTV